MTITVVGLVNTARDAESLVRDLTHHCRCDPTDITLTTLRPENGKGSAVGGVVTGAMKGLVGGAVIGAIIGYVIGAASLNVPGFESVIERGPSATIIVAAVIGAVLGIVAGALGGVERRADGEYSDEDVRRAGTLITIHASENQEADCAVNVLRHHGAREIDKRSSDWNKHAWNTPAPAQPSAHEVAQEPVLRAVPERTAATAPAPDAGLRYNRPTEDATRASAQEQAAAARETASLADTLPNPNMKIDTANWITRKYTATYFGPERRQAANQAPYQGAEKRHPA